jgi:hypothetical protein
MNAELKKNYWKMVKSWINSSDMDENCKRYVYLYLFNSLKEKKKMRVYSDLYEDALCKIPVFVDIETNAIYHQESGDYIGFIKNGEKIIVRYKVDCDGGAGQCL